MQLTVDLLAVTRRCSNQIWLHTTYRVTKVWGRGLCPGIAVDLLQCFPANCRRENLPYALLRGERPGEAVTPDKLYTDAPIQRFMAACKRCDVKWAIFSDLYGVWFPDVTHEWYATRTGI